MDKAKTKTRSSRKPRFTTREQWLQEAVALLNAEFIKPSELGLKMPKKLLITCGFPRGNTVKTIGMHWGGGHAVDGNTTHIAISPILAEPIRVLDVTLHELIHATGGEECTGRKAHGKRFREIAKSFGLEGPPKATIATKGTECYKRLAAIAKTLGKYPHVAIKPREVVPGSGGGGWVRLVSVNEDAYKVVISPKSLEEFGLPVDPWGSEMVAANDQAKLAIAACSR